MQSMKNIQVRKVHQEIKNSILDSLCIIASVIGIPAIIITFINTRSLGHFPIFSLIGILTMIGFVIFKKSVPFQIKGWTMILIGYSIGTIGLIHEGLLSDGLLYYAFICILTSMLINIRSGIIVTSISVATIIILSLIVSGGHYTYDFDIVRYFYSFKTWLGFIITAAFFTFIAVYIYGRLESYLFQYINELMSQSKKLTRSKYRLEQEVAERKQKEKQLKDSEYKFKRVFNNIGDGILLLRPDNTIHDVNKSFLQIIGIGVNLILNKQLESLFQDPERIRLLLKSESTVHSLFDYKEHWLKGGTENRIIPVEVRVLHVTLEQEINRITIIKDITENKENEARIMHAVISSEEEERKRIAQDLHDGIGPYLSAAKMYIDALAINEQSAKELRIKKELYELLQLSIHSIREIAGNLGAQVLRTYGLYTALNKFIEKIRDNFKINFELLLPEKSPFIEKVETALYRILVELINNSVKYASATEIRIKHSQTGNTVFIEYIENGIGFDVDEALQQHKGMGLYNIQSRINSLGGLIDFNAAPGKGVHVRFTFNKNQIYRNTDN
jgi:PAS domain S-box-containing protein